MNDSGQRRSRLKSDVLQGFSLLRQLWDMKVVRYTTLLSLVFFFSYGPLEAAMPLYSDDVLQSGARGYGLLWSALADR